MMAWNLARGVFCGLVVVGLMLTAGRRHASAPDSSIVLYGAEMPPRNPASPHLEFSGFKEGMGMGMGLVPAFAETRLASAPMREGKMPVTVGELQFETQLDLMKAALVKHEAELQRKRTALEAREKDSEYTKVDPNTRAELLIERKREVAALATEVEDQKSTLAEAEVGWRGGSDGGESFIKAFLPPDAPLLVDSGVQDNMDVNHERDEGGVYVNKNIHEVARGHKGGLGDFVKGVQILKRMQNGDGVTRVSHKERGSERRHSMHRAAVLHARSQTRAGPHMEVKGGSESQTKTETFDFKGFGVDLAAKVQWQPGAQAWYAYAQDPKKSSAIRGMPIHWGLSWLLIFQIQLALL